MAAATTATRKTSSAKTLSVRTSGPAAKNNNDDKNNDNNENVSGDNSNIDNKNNNNNTTPTTTTTDNDESPRGKERVKLERSQRADGSFCFPTTSSEQNDSKDDLSNKLETMPTQSNEKQQERVKLERSQRADGSFCFSTTSSEQNDSKDDLSNKLETMPTPSNEKQQNDPIQQDTTEKKPRCPSQYDNVSLTETTPQTDEKTHEIEPGQKRVIQEQPKSQKEEPVNASSDHNELSTEISNGHQWRGLLRHLPCFS